MVIGIDASRTTTPKKTGVEWYGIEIIRELAKLDTTNEYRLYSWEPLGRELADLPVNFNNVVVPPQRFWSFTALATELRRHPVDRLFVPSHLVPRHHPRHTVVTIHDIGFRHFRANYSRYHYFSLQLGTRLSARWASRIVVPSQAVADDVRAAYPVAAGKVTVVPNGYDQRLAATLTANQVVAAMRRHHLSDPYLMFLGRLEVRKNVSRIIEAFYRLRDSGLFGGQLVLAGNPGIGYGEIRALLAKRRGDHSIVLPGYLSNEDRTALLRGARAFIFPSLYEGFGVPILEAFAAGTPVLTSDRGATREVAGDAALLVNPESIESIHQGMQRLLGEEAVAAELVQRGTKRLEGFGWDRTAAAIHQLLVT